MGSTSNYGQDLKLQFSANQYKEYSIQPQNGKLLLIKKD